MKLKELLNGMDYNVLCGDEEININKIEYDSRKIEKGDLFFCVEGYITDGHKYIKDVIQKGAVAVICQKDIETTSNVTVIKVDDVRVVMAITAANYYGRPVEKLRVIGITGTKGKTTSAFLIKSILETAGFKVGLIGTIANYIGSIKVESHRTTPEALELHKLFKEMVDAGVDYCVMEVSSHSLSLNRVYGINFDEGIFTNLSRDHLDFYKTFENYYNAKLMLFKVSKSSIINIDDEYGRRLYDDVSSKKVTYSIDAKSDLLAENLFMHSRGIEFDIIFKAKRAHINLSIPGKFNVMNALCSVAACLNEGISLNVVKAGLEALEGVPGRCELVSKSYNLDFEIILDYAHNPDSLEQILTSAREFTKHNLICVFGCGGNRDESKRPIMGRIGTELSDKAIITSDNPRKEEPEEILKDIIKGITKENYLVIENRRDAIKMAMQIAEKGDVIVLAGKGHEDYQELKDKTIHFDEREIIAEIIKELF